VLALLVGALPARPHGLGHARTVVAPKCEDSIVETGRRWEPSISRGAVCAHIEPCLGHTSRRSSHQRLFAQAGVWTLSHCLRGGGDLADGDLEYRNTELAASPDVNEDCAVHTDSSVVSVAPRAGVEIDAGGAATAPSEIVQEGQARISGTHGGKVFYNRVMVVNRDLSVLMLRWFTEQRKREVEERRRLRLERMKNLSLCVNSSVAESTLEPTNASSCTAHASPDEQSGHIPTLPEEGIKVLDAMSATGLRALRYALEVPEIGLVVANDRDPDAVQAIRRNIDLCGIPAGKIQTVESDAVNLMLSRAGAGDLFDVIDLDPFGTPAALLSSAIHALKPGGMLAVTATDLRVLCGNQPEVCFSRYGSMSLRSPYSKEMAIRILLNAIRSAAAPLGRTVQPVVSVYMDFYVRVFVRIWPNRAGALRACLHTGNVYHCRSCLSFFLQPCGVDKGRSKVGVAYGPPPALRGERDRNGDARAENRDGEEEEKVREGLCCDMGPFLLGGPIWLGGLHDRAVVADVRRMLQESPGSIASGSRLCGLLMLLEMELPTPLFMSHSAMTKVLHCSPPKLSGLRAQIVAAGYNVSQTHTDAEGIKTDAPVALVWDLFRVWLRDRPVSNRRDAVASRLISMDLQVLNASEHDQSSPFYQPLRFNLPDPVQKQMYILRHPTPENASSPELEGAAPQGELGAEAIPPVRHKRTRAVAGAPLFPKNPESNWGPKKSTGFRGRAWPGER